MQLKNFLKKQEFNVKYSNNLKVSNVEVDKMIERI